ncbi:MAG: hypothetical protein RIF34_03095 [Candidatus Kapaibacterium sp.]
MESIKVNIFEDLGLSTDFIDLMCQELEQGNKVGALEEFLEMVTAMGVDLDSDDDEDDSNYVFINNKGDELSFTEDGESILVECSGSTYQASIEDISYL